jgi:hypothetical protein
MVWAWALRNESKWAVARSEAEGKSGGALTKGPHSPKSSKPSCQEGTSSFSQTHLWCALTAFRYGHPFLMTHDKGDGTMNDDCQRRRNEHKEGEEDFCSEGLNDEIRLPWKITPDPPCLGVQTL